MALWERHRARVPKYGQHGRGIRASPAWHAMEGGPAQGNIAKKGVAAYGLLPPRPSAGQHGTTHPVVSALGDHGSLGAGLWLCPEQWHGSVRKVWHQNSKKWAAWAWHSDQPCRACDGGWSSTSKYNKNKALQHTGCYHPAQAPASMAPRTPWPARRGIMDP